jgi:hypothetical protein
MSINIKQGEDIFSDLEIDRAYDGARYADARERYEMLNTDYIINRLIQYGEEANDVSEHFPAYDVAVQCRKKSNNATEKQHNAMAHVLAYIDTVW